MNMDFDPLEDVEPRVEPPGPAASSSQTLAAEATRLQARADAFRALADRFYMLWWNLPGMTTRQADNDVQDMFRMLMDLAPSLGVSRNGIPELRECCGRKRTWRDDPLTGDPKQKLVMAPVREPELGWCPGDIIRRITRFFGADFCEPCDQRRRRINAFFFRCGGR